MTWVGNLRIPRTISEPEASAGGVEEPEDSDENLDGDYFNLLNPK